jgi:hypothetical protein
MTIWFKRLGNGSRPYEAETKRLRFVSGKMRSGTFRVQIRG